MKAAADQDVPDTHRKTASFLENEKVYFLLEQKKTSQWQFIIHIEASS